MGTGSAVARPVRLTVLLSLLAVLVVGVSSAPAGPAPGPVAARSLSSTGEVRLVARRSTCPAGQPRQLLLDYGNPADQAKYGDDIVICTDLAGTRTYVGNAAEVLWLVEHPSGLQWKESPPDLAGAVYEEALALFPRTGALALLPGRSALLDVGPAGVRVRLDPSHQAACWAVDRRPGVPSSPA